MSKSNRMSHQRREFGARASLRRPGRVFVSIGAPRPSDPLADRWRWALDDARRQGIGDFWIVYRFDTPTHAQDLMMSDTREGTTVSTSGRLITQGPPSPTCSTTLEAPATSPC